MMNECDCKFQKLTKKMVGGGYQYRMQCQGCGKKGNAIAKAKLTDEQMYQAEEPDDSLRDEYWKRRNEQYAIESREKSRKWWRDYQAYLLSPQWQDKRKRVFERDDWVCQSCLEQPATQVHHTTYAHRFNEPLFELQSICDKCHEQITEMDRGRNAAMSYMPQ